ncbi:hypothetical protein A2303_05340 [Candidatus Falkowbacteria bacterium RIFOXYB2_FULL_47_14]|uniref:Prepilin type IV endopeptidase peptidase domain-containing protein n=1 Tax=Candidatus Falkowbacteria bacterium RIFOXYA2_FULL_47_19 TaxID=1797994 RepID=A0A1F5SFD4_9BACT|nr:MAG: hypothetical protein A2227_08050 [Candidatus Falkowbacteria bacterium RIFOXYA2_FULL_47_19]OGF34375.1 MAG: hypothetical protein A2468_05040 [Candidatus Falkowbacteria bacterium RIFOXYC2_FULL_46_15]OGF43274.1 MAG: hypothetical protein A2303_05340 [Candidatus Falkowbacteria bacterium RIFOXYB2_FULL_47_14]
MNIDPISILLLPAVFFIGTITSIEDIRMNKIRNKWILFGSAYGLAALFGLLIWNLSAYSISDFYYTNIAKIGLGDPRPVFTVHWGFFWKTGLNGFLSLILGFALWKNNIMAAGDAKLFFVYALLIPINYYWRSYLPLFPSLALLINIFAVVLGYFLIRSAVYFLARSVRRLGRTAAGAEVTKEKTASKRGEYRRQLKMIFGFMSFFLFFYFLRIAAQKYWSIDIGAGVQAFFIILVVFSRRMTEIFFNKPAVFWTILAIGAGLCAYGLLTDPGLTLSMLAGTAKTMIIFMFAMGLIAKLVDFYVSATGSVDIPIAELEPGMVVERNFWQNLTDRKMLANGFFAGGLSEAETESVKALARDKRVEIVTVCRKFPFAAWMFLAVIATLLLQGSIINLIIYSIK